MGVFAAGRGLFEAGRYGRGDFLRGIADVPVDQLAARLGAGVVEIDADGVELGGDGLVGLRAFLGGAAGCRDGDGGRGDKRDDQAAGRAEIHPS